MCVRFRAMRVSVSTATNIYTIRLYGLPKVWNCAADYEKKYEEREREKATQLFKRRLTNIFVESNVSIFH
jgi:hypothetical protein